MLGLSLALVSGVQRRHGWRIAAMAGAAAALPDWDGLSLIFGPEAYAAAHRVWGHNVLVASAVGAMAGAIEYRFHWLGRLGRLLLRLLPKLTLPESGLPAKLAEPSPSSMVVWVITGMLASLSHLPADYVCSGHRDMKAWEVPLLWPFSSQGWVKPLVAWGDVGPTIVFIAEMFALAVWPPRAQLIAGLTLLAVLAYVGLRWILGGVYG